MKVKNNNLTKSKAEIKSTQWKLQSVGKKKTNTRFILVRQQPVPTSNPQATTGSWDFFQPCKILYKPKIHKGCTLPCSLWTTKWMYPPFELIHKRCTLSCSQYNNPSRCTLYLYHKGCTLQCVKTKDSQVVSPLNLCKGKQKISQAVSPLKYFV